MLEVIDLNKDYYRPDGTKFKAVNQLNITLPKGQTLGITGPNGAGKSTTLLMLAAMLTPTSGKILLDGKSIIGQNRFAMRAKIGYLSSTTNMWKGLTVSETLTYFGNLQKMETSKLNKRKEELIHALHMEDYAHQFCESLSTGQTQRANIARTLIHSPKLVILDEITSGLDMASSKKVLNLVNQIKEDDCSILFCSHHGHELREVGDQILILERGKRIDHKIKSDWKEPGVLENFLGGRVH